MKNWCALLILLFCLGQATFSQSWQLCSGNFVSSQLKLVDFPTDQVGYAAGYDGTIVKTTDSGASWLELNFPLSAYLNSISFANPDTGYVIVLTPNRIYATYDGGQNWTQVYDSQTSGDHMSEVLATNNNSVIAAGRNGVFIRSQDFGSNWVQQVSGPGFGITDLDRVSGDTIMAGGIVSGIYASYDDGLTWNFVDSVLYQNIHDISFPTSQTGYVSYGNRINKTTDQGHTWTTVLDLTANPEFLYDLQFLDANNGYGLSYQDSLFKTTDGGQSWTTTKLPSSTSKMAFHVSSNGDFHVVGDHGLILKSPNGQTWDRYGNQFSDYDIRTAHFPSSQIGYFGTSNGGIWRSTDGGGVWNYRGHVSSASLNSIFFIDDMHGYCGANDSMIYATVNGGRNWAPYPQKFSGSIQDIFFPDANTGYAVGYSVYLKTTDGGQSWDSIYGLGPYFPAGSVWFNNPDTGFVGGAEGTIYHTLNGGASWASRSWQGDRFVSDIFFVDDQLGFAVQEDSVLKTTDGGFSWDKKANSVSGDGSHRSIYFVDADTGYAAGLGLYKSTDGGENWHGGLLSNTPDLNTVLFATNSIGYAFGPNGIVYCLNQPPVGTQESYSSNIQLLLYPQPATGNTLFLNLEGKEMGTLGLKLFNLSGKLMQTSKSKKITEHHEMQLDISALPPGVFILELNLNGQRTSKKLIKL